MFVGGAVLTQYYLDQLRPRLQADLSSQVDFRSEIVKVKVDIDHALLLST